MSAVTNANAAVRVGAAAGAGTVSGGTAPLPAHTWRELESTHAARADALTDAHRARRKRGDTHPIEDFLFTYYPFKPAELRKWHPGAAVTLLGATERTEWRYYSAATAPAAAAAEPAGAAASPSGPVTAARVDVREFFAKRAQTVDYVEGLLRATLSRTPQFGCFGLHEWAMVYRLSPEEVRHTRMPLRVGHEATDAVVESHTIGCSHFDAYRFFTPAAAPLNRLSPTRASQPDMEQSGCLHAGMDIYKWVTKLGPIIPGPLLLDAFEFARDIRYVDMQASPYDVTGFVDHAGVPLTPIPIETPAGKQEYVRRQRGFADRGNALRTRVLDAIATARAELAVTA